ncbi:MAG: hypothetical protein KDA67_02785 [Rhodobacteraceae bacterium]|nr:hypothetical protein [Paracoccaceae bacterium]
MARLRHLWQHHKGLVLAFGLAAAVTLFFAVRFLAFYIYWQDPAHHQQPLEPWMTPRYVAWSYDLPLAEVTAMLGISETPSFRPTLSRLAREQGVPVNTLINNLATSLAARTANRP